MSSSHQTLYRKYRPQTFADVVAQEHVVNTLARAVHQGKLAHAYLFSGPRGTGKTTVARLLAKAANCLSEDAAARPCGECSTCLAIAEGSDLDVVEIDAASHRGIDEIRDLREKVRFAPLEGRSKIYIIDEVHMLTEPAFNALLKTLEEPPEHVLFVLATTELQKVPRTIQSRCQRFEFRPLKVADLVDQLKKVAEAEGIEVEPGALAELARASSGGLRDALAGLEQLSAFCEGTITAADVAMVLGTSPWDRVFRATETVLGGSIPEVLMLVEGLEAEGQDLRTFCQGLAEHLRHLMLLAAAGGTADLVDAPEDILAQMREQAAKAPAGRWLLWSERIYRSGQEMRLAGSPRLHVELSLLGLLEQRDDLAERISKLEATLAQQAQGAPARNPTPAPRQSPPRADEREAAEPSAPRTSEAPRPAAKAPAASPPDAASGTLTFDTVKKSWPAVMREVRTKRIAVYALLLEGHPVDLTDGEVVIQFGPRASFHRSEMEKEPNRALVAEVLAKTFAVQLGVRCVSRDDGREEEQAPVEEFSGEALVGELKRRFAAEEVDADAPR